MSQDNEDQAFDNNETESESEAVTKKRYVVIPGEVIATGEDYLPSDGARRVGEDIIANRFGLAEEAGRVIKVLPITGAFVPRRNNIVIGRVSNITGSGWIIDIDASTSAFLPIDESPRFINKHEMDQFLAIGEVIVAKIWNVNTRGIDLSLKSRGLGKLESGFIFRVSSSRIPRVIGREGSMINLIKDKTQCDIVAGQNGWVWIKGENMDSEIKARQIIEFITEKVHLEGLTEKVEEMLS